MNKKLEDKRIHGGNSKWLSTESRCAYLGNEELMACSGTAVSS